MATKKKKSKEHDIKINAAKRFNFNSKWLKLRMIEKGISQRELGKRLDVDSTAVNHMINGRRTINKTYLAIIAAALGITLPELLAGLKHTGSQPDDENGLGGGKGLDIAGWIDGALVVHLGAVRGPRRAPDPDQGKTGGTIEVLRCQTMGSQFDGIDGALVYYFPNKRVDPDSLQRLCIVEIGSKGNLKAMRVVKRGYSVGKYNLALFNGVISEEDAELASSSPVMWLKM